MDSLHDLCIPPILYYLGSRSRMAELDCHRVLCGCRGAGFVGRHCSNLRDLRTDNYCYYSRIYLVRLIVGKFYEYRISKTQKYLDDLQNQRDATIEKLKEATKYNSTQQLLEKYGAESPNSARDTKEEPKQGGPTLAPQSNLPPVSRTGIAPPPTANIRRTSAGPLPSHTPPPPPTFHDPVPPTLNDGLENRDPHAPDEPGFAPNAFSGPPPPSTPPAAVQQPHETQYSDYGQQGRWYDRLVDVLLGEDETLPKNRLALICAQCRLVNGQAPPGVKNLGEVERWRCGGCGSWNGHDSTSEARKVIADIQEQTRSYRNSHEHGESGIAAASAMREAESDTSGPEVKAEEDQTDGEVEEPDPPKTKRRGRPPKGGKK